MERNTVNIDLVDYNELLIKAEKYDALPKKRNRNSVQIMML